MALIRPPKAFGNSTSGVCSKLDTNPCVGIEHLYSNDRSSLIWTDDDFAALKPHASREVLMTAKLASLTGLRRGDLLRLSWSHVGDLAVEIRTGKSGGRKTTSPK